MADVSSNERKIKLTKSGKVVKRRTKNPEEWHKQKQKRLRIAGLEYINANGKLVPPKQPGPDCHCRRGCFQKVPEDVRLKTFQGFYSMRTHDEQNAYLFGLMRQVDVKRKRVKGKASRRTCTFEYFVRVKGRETQVCQTAFKNIHAITERKVRVLCKKMDDGVMFPSDNRGKNSHRRSGEVRLPTGVVDQIKNHIYSIVHTHRLKDFIRLDKIAGLEINISKMWKDYIKTYDPENIIATMPKSKRSIEVEVPPAEPVVQPPPPPQEQLFGPMSYPGSGHLVNIAENYFQNQYPTTTLTPTTATNFYQPQNGGPSMGILLQPTAARPQHAAYIVLQTKSEPQANPTTLAIDNVPYNDVQELECQTVVKVEKKVKRERKRGPLVKQWRYTNIFHEEINGAALAAIKTRLGMYYAESDAARKKVKQARPAEAAAVQIQTQPEQIRPTHTEQIRPTHTEQIRPTHTEQIRPTHTEQIRPTHTVTIYT